MASNILSMNNTSTRKTAASYAQRALRIEAPVSNNDSVLSQLQLIHAQLSDKISQLEHVTSQESESDNVPILEKVNLLLQSQADLIKNKINDDLQGKLHQVAQKHADVSKQLKSDIDSVVSKINKYDSSINVVSQQLNMLTSQVARLKADLAIAQATIQSQQDIIKSNIKEFLTVGSAASLPEQPEPVMEAGVWKEAPLALVVSGGLALHNIGYTTKKGKALSYDPETNRLYIYNGK